LKLQVEYSASVDNGPLHDVTAVIQPCTDGCFNNPNYSSSS